MTGHYSFRIVATAPAIYSMETPFQSETKAIKIKRLQLSGGNNPITWVWCAVEV